MDELLSERAGPTLILTLNRPDKMNALSGSLVEALHDQIESATISGIRLLILKGNGRNFSAGFDFGDFDSQSEGDLVLRFVRIEQLLQAVYHAPFNTMALAHGPNFGAGVDLICSCGRRVGDPGASFQMPGLSFGLVLGTRRYSERVGRSRARMVLEESVSFDAGALEDGFLTTCASVDVWADVVSSATRASVQLLSEANAALLRATSCYTRAADLA